MTRRIALVATLAAAMLLVGASQREPKTRLAQYGTSDAPAVGRILVASEKLGDPNFRESVVLIIRFDSEKGTLGLIINRRSKVPISRIFPDVTGAKADPVYMGGPVELSTAQALLRSPSKSDDLVHVLGSVYATANKDIIEKSISAGAEPSKFHLYMGYAGWAADQLEAEMELGAWSVLRTNPDEIFDEDPDSLWTRLSRKAESQIAFNARPNPRMIPSSH
ncbi:MAG: YqgE/AlgH family protein [Bryobacteraceae bacterium]